ncbi:MAG TPA: hypothetical protein ENI87_14020 [bacterium]|nr:hypothetical protein [bacterium]
MNPNVVRAVWMRDLRSWFGNPAGYVFIVLFVALAGVALMFSPQFFTNNLANLDTLNAWFPLLAILFVSVSTMNIWASERANGTQELLFTLPGSDLDLHLGKFLSAMSVYTISLLFMLAMPITLMFLGNPDWGQLFANYVGYWLFGVMLVAVSMVGSQLTQNGTVALLLSLLLCVVVVFFGTVVHWAFDARDWVTNGPIGQFRLFAGGEIPFSGIVLYLGLTVTFFYLGLLLLARRSWRRGSEPVHGTLRFASYAVITFALTVIGVQVLPRIDATVEGIHSLSDETAKLLGELDPQRPVLIKAFVSEEVPEQFVQQKKLLLNLLDQFDSLGGAAVQKEVIMPEPYSPQARAAERNYGIQSQTVPIALPGGGSARVQMYLGFAVISGTNEVVTPFIGPAVPLEYELMRSIRTVANAERRKVGILKTDVELFGGFDMQTFQQKPRWAIAQELEQQYEIVNVDPTSDYPDDIDCLVVAQGSSLEQEAMTRLQEYVLAGHPTLFFEDPMPVDPQAAGTAADDPKGGPQAQMMGRGGPQKGNWVGFLRAIGIEAPVGEVVWDLSYRTFPGGGAEQELVFVRAPGMSSESAITKGLQSYVQLYGGYCRAIEQDGLTFKPLLRSRPPGGTDAGNGTVAKSELFQRNFFGGMQRNPYPRRKIRNQDLTLAAHVTGKPAEDAEKGRNFIYVCDLDVIGNVFFQLRAQATDANFRFDNVAFALNCIDTLVGDDSLIELRKRRPILRKLTKVEEAQKEFEDKWQREKEDAEKAAKKSLDAAQERFDAAVAKIREDETLDEQAKAVKIEEVQANENRKLDLEKAQIEDKKRRRLEEAQHDRDAARASIHDRYRVIALLLSVIPGILLGVITFVRRSSRAAAIVPHNRQVGGSN